MANRITPFPMTLSDLRAVYMPKSLQALIFQVLFFATVLQHLTTFQLAYRVAQSICDRLATC